MKNKKIAKFIFVAVLLAMIVLPLLSFAQTPGSNTYKSNPTMADTCKSEAVGTVGNIICRIGYLLNRIIPVLISLGVIYFIWGVVQYMIGGDEEKKKKGKEKIIYGIIGLVVIVGMWGLVNLVIKSFGLQTKIPTDVATNLTKDIKTQTDPQKCALASQPALGNLIKYVTCTISGAVIPLLFILAVASFLWGVLQYVMNADSEEKRSKGRQFMIWGIIALVVMTSIWGIVKIVGGTFNIETNYVPQVKQQ